MKVMKKPKLPWVQSRLHEQIFEIIFSFSVKHSESRTYVLYVYIVCMFGQLIEYHSTERVSPCNGFFFTV